MIDDLPRLIPLCPPTESLVMYRAHLPVNHCLESDIDAFLMEMIPSIALQLTTELRRSRGALKVDLLLALDVFQDATYSIVEPHIRLNRFYFQTSWTQMRRFANDPMILGDFLRYIHDILCVRYVCHGWKLKRCSFIQLNIRRCPHDVNILPSKVHSLGFSGFGYLTSCGGWRWQWGMWRSSVSLLRNGCKQWLQTKAAQ